MNIRIPQLSFYEFLKESPGSFTLYVISIAFITIGLTALTLFLWRKKVLSRILLTVTIFAFLGSSAYAAFSLHRDFKNEAPYNQERTERIVYQALNDQYGVGFSQDKVEELLEYDKPRSDSLPAKGLRNPTEEQVSQEVIYNDTTRGVDIPFKLSLKNNTVTLLFEDPLDNQWKEFYPFVIEDVKVKALD
jgi:hypothetical protein